MATTENTYTGDNSTTLFSFTFPYLEESDVKVSLDGVDQATSEYFFANATTISFNTAPANGVAIRIYRVTATDSAQATFFAGSGIRAQDLNDNNLQILYATQETVNRRLDSTGGSLTGNLDMNGNKVVDLGAPTAATDAATRGYIDGLVLSATIPDGDRGDITVSASGATWTIDDGVITSDKVAGGVITSAKIANDTIVNADVNSSAGIVATKLSFTQSGTGATARTIDSKLKDVVSVKDFGATGDGTTDDAAAIQAAIDANPGKAILIPSGTYLINTTISVDVSGADAACIRLVGDGSTQTIINNQTGGAAFDIDSGTGAVFAYDAAFENLQITSVGSQAGTIGIQLDGCRFARIKNVRITDMALHGIYGYSTVGDFTDTAQILIEQSEITGCGGYGIYAQSDTTAIQYNWNLNQVRVGNCTLGGVLWESMVNARIENCGIFYNDGFGLKITQPAGGNSSKLITIANTEFDTNDGVQIDLDVAEGVKLDQVYLVANTGLSQTFTKGIVVGASCSNITTNQMQPRLDPTLTGINVLEVEAGATDVVARDTNYNGYLVANGNMYVDNTVSLQLYIDDRSNRHRAYTGTYTVTVGNLSDATVSATTQTGHYSVAGNTVTAGFRNLNNIDLTGFPGSSIITFTLPKACITADVGFIGNAIVTNDSGSANPPYPVATNGSNKSSMQRAGTAAFLTEADLTSGTSDVAHFTLTYIWE